MRDTKKRTFGAALLVVQGAVTAAFPRVSAGFVKRAIAKNFNDAAQLEAKPAYLRQLRALGVGMIAAGGTSLLLEDGTASTDDDAPDDDE